MVDTAPNEVLGPLARSVVLEIFFDDRQVPAVSVPLERLRADLATLRRELAAMSRDESAAHAWYGGSNSSLSGLVPAGSPKAHPLVAQNPDFFDHSRPCTDIQLITVRLAWEGLSADFIGKKRLEEFLQTNDWKAIASLMD